MLVLRVKPDNYEIREMYLTHTTFNNGDAGIDLFFVKDQVIPKNSTVLVNLEISCEMRDIIKYYGRDDMTSFNNSSYWLLPRSSIYKTPLRMSNSIGLIDSGYRGNIKVPLDNFSSEDYTIKKGERLFQITTPQLTSFNLIVTDSLSTSERLENGFGSTGK